ncbi:hypothetical protein HPB47_020553, partial [Ixodes persulcatus]
SEICINEEFCAVLTSSSTNVQHRSRTGVAIPPSTDERMNVAFRKQEMETALDSSNSKSTLGPDDVKYSDLIHLGPEAKTRLLALFNISWERGLVPATWEKSRILPLLKPDKSMLHISFYHPITLASCICKLVDYLVKKLSKVVGIMSH